MQENFVRLWSEMLQATLPLGEEKHQRNMSYSDTSPRRSK